MVTGIAMRAPVLVAGAALLLAVAGDVARPAPAAPTAAAAIEAGASGCGTGRLPLRPGRQALLLRNDGGTATNVTLTDPATGAVYAELESLGPGTDRVLRITLGPGSYAFRCAQDGPGDPVTGPVTRLTGTGSGAPGIVPVAENDLYAPTRSYQAYVSAGLDRLVARTDALRSAVDDGDLGAARAAWTPAHMAYERLGAAYGTFGDFDGRINGRPAGRPAGVRDPGFTGFHRVEYGLWHGESASSLAAVTDRLARDVRALRSDFPDERIDPADLPLRAHEILENTLQFQLTGEADQGSGTTLRTAAANLEGTRELVDVLRPLLRPRYQGLATVDAWTDRMAALLKGRSSVDRLSRADRERLNGAAGELLERLAPIATICAPRRRAQGTR
ncbi:EfeM/EfeO family lipoprotein [Actinoallomurus purpureus]|uniref:EfeM/EfeO family lipoprotein n=1 Tax=Actinoallomurus purpureus TaxID=478114 RepID=UPI002093FD2D|nr:EfeM/EfeO family lipoprotein [Actinoallomurus purpureus]MCO6009621.1 EfeM/EfeO family lipoprotein [Actinoallomurus purpureus]